MNEQRKLTESNMFDGWAHLERAIDQCEKDLGTGSLADRQRLFAHTYTSRGRFSLTQTGKLTNFPRSTMRVWLERADVQALMQALVAREAARLIVSRRAVLTEIASIGLSDISEIARALIETGETGPEAVAQLPQHLSKSLKRVRFESTLIHGKGEDKPRLETTIKDIEVHPKLDALKVLAPWFGFKEDSELEERAAAHNAPLVKIMGPSDDTPEEN